MTGNNRIDISNNSSTLVRTQCPTYLSQYNPKLPINLDSTISPCEPKSVLPNEVTPDRPPKYSKPASTNTDNSNNSNNSNNGAKNQAFKNTEVNEQFTSLSSPGRSGSPPLRRPDNSNPYNSPYPSNQRHFPATPQYEQIYTADPATNNKNSILSPDLSQHPLTKSPLKRVRLADDVVVTPKRYRGETTNTIQSPFSRAPAYPMARNSEPSYLRPRPGPYAQFGSAGSGDKAQQQHGESTPVSSSMMSHKQQQPQQTHVVENESNEVELVLKTSTTNAASNLIASSPDRSVSSRGPYTQMTRGEVSEPRETALEGKQPSTNLGKKVKSPPRDGVGTSDRMKANIVSPPEEANGGGGQYSRGGGPYREGGGGGHNRASSFNSMHEYSSAAPESPYNSYSLKGSKSWNTAYNPSQNPPHPQSPFRNSSTSNQSRPYFKYPPSSPVKSNSPPRAPAGHHNSPSYGTSGAAPSAPPSTSNHPFYNSYPPSNYTQGSGGAGDGAYYQEENFRDGSPSRGSPGKRQRVTEMEDKKSSNAPTNPPGLFRYPPNPNPYSNGRQTVQSHPHYPEQIPTASESFDADSAYPRKPGEGGTGGMAAPSVLKVSSYPPPRSPRTDNANVSSAASYPGNAGPGRSPPPHPHEGNGEYGYGAAPSRLPIPPPYRPEYYYPNDPAFHPNGGRMEEYPQAPSEQPYYPDPHAAPPAQQPSQPGAGGAEFYDPPVGEYPYYRAPQSHQPHQTEEPNETHPLLRNYDIDRDRRVPIENDPNSPQSPSSLTPNSPENNSPKTPSQKPKDLESGSGESASVSSSSPDRRKPATAAHAAIAAGMTQPPSAQEVDFDIHNPPLKPVTMPSNEPACPVPSNVNSNDVLCGRGGGTNTQIGNRRFRSLVQEFQPIYLLCRRKEKPLIARTIVLIIRHRGGRFLKKDEVSGMLFEVGDEKAEAKTSQALREGLDVRASKGSSTDSKRKSRKKKQTSMTHPTEQNQYGEDVTMADTTPPREGPPSHNDGHPPYPGYYYGGGYEEYPHPAGGGPGYDFHPHHPPQYTPSRKRQRPPPPAVAPGMYPYHNAPPYKGYGYPPSHAPHAPPSHQEYYPAPHRQVGGGPGVVGSGPGGDEDHSVWEMDFSPPRGFKREDGVGHGGEDPAQAGYGVQENHL